MSTVPWLEEEPITFTLTHELQSSEAKAVHSLPEQTTFTTYWLACATASIFSGEHLMVTSSDCGSLSSLLPQAINENKRIDNRQ